MKRDCSTCICKEGSCYPSTTIFDKDKTCKSYDPDYEGYIADLEKENAELKGLKDVATLIRANNDTVVTLMQLNNMLVSKDKQLTKAKEIIKILLKYDRGQFFDDRRIYEKYMRTRGEAEQFLKESE